MGKIKQRPGLRRTQIVVWCWPYQLYILVDIVIYPALFLTDVTCYVDIGEVFTKACIGTLIGNHGRVNREEIWGCFLSSFSENRSMLRPMPDCKVLSTAPKSPFVSLYHLKLC